MPATLKYALLMLFSAVLMAGSACWSPVWYDDAGHWLVAREGAMHGTPCYPVGPGDCRADSPFITMGPALTWPLVGWMAVFGTEMAVARVLMVLLSLLSLGAVGLLAREALGAGGKAFWAMLVLMGGIQWVTYGAEVLGEVPMLGLACLGAWGMLRWIKGGAWWYGVLALVAWSGAVQVKEYFLVVVGLALIFWVVASALPGAVNQSINVVKGYILSLQGRGQGQGAMIRVLLGLAILGLWALSKGGGLLEYLAARGSYDSEFLVFDLAEGMRFLLLKPLFWIGTVALVVRWYVRRTDSDLFLLCLQGAWVVFFLASAGYDRFGFQLLVLPALAVSEFLVLAWRRWVRGRVLRVVALAAVGLPLFWQQTLWVLPQRAMAVPNAEEKAVGEWFRANGVKAAFTYDQQIAPFLPEGVGLRLAEWVPSNADACEDLRIPEGEVLVVGIYARTVYAPCWNGVLRLSPVYVGGYRLSGRHPMLL